MSLFWLNIFCCGWDTAKPKYVLEMLESGQSYTIKKWDYPNSNQSPSFAARRLCFNLFIAPGGINFSLTSVKMFSYNSYYLYAAIRFIITKNISELWLTVIFLQFSEFSFFYLGCFNVLLLCGRPLLISLNVGLV